MWELRMEIEGVTSLKFFELYCIVVLLHEWKMTNFSELKNRKLLTVFGITTSINYFENTKIENLSFSEKL
jgi:hypothetical protein